MFLTGASSIKNTIDKNKTMLKNTVVTIQDLTGHKILQKKNLYNKLMTIYHQYVNELNGIHEHLHAIDLPQLPTD